MLSKLKTYALLAAACIIAGLAIFAAIQGHNLKNARSTAARLEQNQATLLSELTEERTLSGKLQANVTALTLRKDELEELLPVYERRLQDMRVKLKDAQHIADVALQASAQVVAVRDTIYQYIEGDGENTTRMLHYSDAWLDADITVQGDTALLAVRLRDSLLIVGHREPRKCIFRRPRVTHYSVVPSSPYTTITGLHYIEVVEK